MKVIRQQPRVRGVVRKSAHTSLLPEIDEKLRELADRYRVSKSWVKATILADALHIRKQPKYYMAAVPIKRRKRA